MEPPMQGLLALSPTLIVGTVGGTSMHVFCFTDMQEGPCSSERGPMN